MSQMRIKLREQIEKMLNKKKEDLEDYSTYGQDGYHRRTLEGWIEALEYVLVLIELVRRHIDSTTHRGD